jgi:hypothetical protein
MTLLQQIIRAFIVLVILLDFFGSPLRGDQARELTSQALRE